MDQNLPFVCGTTQERTGRTGSNLPQFLESCRKAERRCVCLPRACWDMKEKSCFLLLQEGVFETDLIVWAWLLFFPFLGRKNNIWGTKQECKRDVCCVWFRRRLRKDSLSLVVWLWEETSQRPALYFFPLPLSFLVAIQHFISTDISRFEDVDARFTPEDAFQAVSLLTARLIYCSCR